MLVFSSDIFHFICLILCISSCSAGIYETIKFIFIASKNSLNKYKCFPFTWFKNFHLLSISEFPSFILQKKFFISWCFLPAAFISIHSFLFLLRWCLGTYHLFRASPKTTFCTRLSHKLTNVQLVWKLVNILRICTFPSPSKNHELKMHKYMSPLESQCNGRKIYYYY